MASVDLTVRGAGIIGLSIAWEAAERGARVRVVDPAGPGAGASGGIVGALAPHVPENWNPKKAFQLDSLIRAEAFWADVEAASGAPSGYARSGRVQPLADTDAVTLARSREDGARALWPERFAWNVEPADLAMWGIVSASGLMLRDTLSGRLHPARACAALAAALSARGVEIVQEAPEATPTIWAAGWEGLRDLGAHLDRAVGQPIKGQAALFALDRRDQPQLFIDGLHVIGHDDGTTAVGSTTERATTSTTTDDALEDLIARARALVPALADAPVVTRWAGLRPRARSRAPLMDAWPGRPGHFVANGGFKIGFGMAPGIARSMVDLVLDDRVTFPDDFRFDAL